jgi:predicted transcriptional regulator of viral defense system
MRTLVSADDTTAILAEGANRGAIGLLTDVRQELRSAELQVARIAARQHGVVTARQLATAGVSASSVARRVARGQLHRVHRGVYRVGHVAPSLEARYLAAVLACGEGAVLSGRAAAFLYGLIKGSPPRPEVTSMAERRVPGVVSRRVRRLDRRDVTTYRGIPILTFARVVIELAASLPLDALARVAHEAEVRHRLTARQLEGAVGRHPRPAGG